MEQRAICRKSRPSNPREATMPQQDIAASTFYDRACRSLAEAKAVDEVKDIRDKAVAMATYARQAKNRELEADAVVIRMRATRRLDQMRQEQAATIGLAKGTRGSKVKGARVDHKPTLADAGIDKNLANEGRKLGALSEPEFDQKVAEVSAAVRSVVAKVVKSINLPKAEEDGSAPGEGKIVEITIAQWKTMSEKERRACLDPHNYPSDVRFNKQTSEGIDWAQSSWNAIVGCNHPCQRYCWAKDITLRFPNRYPHGFAPVLRPRMLGAPYNTKVPPEASTDWRFKNVFSGSMSDEFGGWLPPEWIEAVLAAERANPQWNFLHLTKFPNRLLEFDIPPNAWLGTTVDVQARVANAEAAFAKLREKLGKDAILWLSIEPMLEPLTFKRLDLFDWMVVGGAAQSMRTPEFRPPGRWIADLYRQADAAGVKIFEKTNLHGNRILELPFDAPVKNDFPQVAPEVFHYLGKKGPAR
jgi:protein gp37